MLYHVCKDCGVKFFIGHSYILDTHIISDVVFKTHIYNCCSIIKTVFVDMWPDFWKGTTFIKTSQKQTVVVYTTIHFQWMFSTLYLSFKAMDNLNAKFSKHFIKKLLMYVCFWMVWLKWCLIANQADITLSYQIFIW